MKRLFINIIFISAVLNTNSTVANDEVKIFTAQGYPYKQLIARTDSVKILFIERSNKVQCRTQVVNDKLKHTTQPILITQEQFKEKPLANCLARKEAKLLLANTY